MYSDFCKIVRDETISRILTLYLGWENGHPNLILLPSAKPKAIWPANSKLHSRGRSSTRDRNDISNLTKQGLFWLMFVFQAKKESCEEK